MFLEYNMHLDENSISYEAHAINQNFSMPIKITGMGHLYCKENYFTKRKGLNEFLLLYTIGGEGKLFYNDTDYYLKKNSIIIINCEHYQEYQTKISNWEFLYFHFEKDYFGNLFNVISQNNMCFFEDTPVEIKGLLFSMLQIKNIDTVKKNLEINQLVPQIINALYDSLMDVKHNRLNSNIVSAAIALIKENYLNSLTLTEISKCACVSKFHFLRIFKEFTGTTPNEYIINLKMSHAKKILVSTDKTLEEISEILGYTSASSFIRAFKFSVGLTPKAFKNSLL